MAWYSKQLLQSHSQSDWYMRNSKVRTRICLQKRQRYSYLIQTKSALLDAWEKEHPIFEMFHLFHQENPKRGPVDW